jgi:hypothetical protein
MEWVYNSTMNGNASPSGAILHTEVGDLSAIPDAPSARNNNDVKSVFPNLMTVLFSPWGDSFMGAYRDNNNNVYAVIGEMIPDPMLMLATLSGPEAKLPVENIYSFQENQKPAPPFGEEQVPLLDERPDSLVDAPISRVASGRALTVTGLLNLSPMVVDKDDPSGFRDSVAQLAMKDFHDIMVYYMEDDLRRLFISASPIVLPSKVLAIATDNVEVNRAFYRKLQVPYLASFLAGSEYPFHYFSLEFYSQI